VQQEGEVMKILKLKLRGAIGIRKGLGVEEVEIDFSNFQSGLIALTGRNGSGKTTVMENLHPYRQMVSRDGSLQSHFFLKDSYRSLDFEFNGRSYRSKILIDALTGGSEAYLLELKDNTTFALNDGKLTTYDKAIEDLLGSPELFFNSVFSGQKSKGIAELKPADRRKLFYELLNLNSYEVYLEESKLKLKLCENDLAKIEGEIKALQQDQTSIDVLEIERQEKLEYQAQLISDISELESSVEGASEVIRETEVKIQIAHQKVLANDQIQKELKEIENQILVITKQNNEKVARYQGDIEDQNKLLERYKKLSTPEAKEKIEQALADKKEHQNKLDELKTVASNLDKGYAEFQKEYSEKLKSLSVLEKSKSEVENQLNTHRNDFNNYQKLILTAVESSDVIDRVPCEENIGKSCEFLLKAHSERQKIDRYKSDRELIRVKVLSSDESLADLINRLNGEKINLDQFFQDKDNYFRGSIKTNGDAIKLIEQTLTKINQHNYEKLLDELKEADNQIKLCEQSISGHEKLIAESKLSFEQNLASLKKQVEDLNRKYDKIVLVRIEELNSDLLIHKQKLLGLNQQLQSSRARIDEAKQDVAKLEQLIETMTKNEERITKLLESKSKVESEIKDWNFLVKAFDKTGIPVLKLENSGIEITSVANELLSIFENKFRIVFETTKLKADKKSYKESFDINIVEEDGVCEISNKSGGQQVWLETAIQLAISLVVRNQGRNIETAFLDEKDGALDLDNAYSYIEMLRKAHQMSGVHNTFIITHRPELLDFIPQQVKLKDGILEVVN
jgi:exonuclease SbcC